MLRIHFTAEDLLGVRFADAPAPLLELGLAVAMLQRGDGGPGFVRRRRLLGTARTRAAVAPLRQLVPPSGAGPLFLDPPSDDLDQGMELVRRSTATLVRAELTRITTAGLPVTALMRRLAEQDRDAWQYLETAMRTAYPDLVGTVWPRLRAGFDTDLAWRGRVHREQGLRGMLAGLHPGSRWRGSTLEVPSERDRDVRLDGAGLVLMPSAQWTGGPLVGSYPQGKLMVYPALTALPYLPEPESAFASAPGAAPDDPIAALLGRTRAAVLRLTSREPTTSQLAQLLGISLASASEHARALRRAGLVATVRTGRAVRHGCTPLGHRLLAGSDGNSVVRMTNS
ncbi:helix-turn-helix transcriptional regulator [Streptomyces kaniharaensis]|uniref:Helix-turn-helix transcriptional regulator n=1 Tax=Streptomyces kaniharaensis TaxID=212423 RepID=A0A6N7KWE2_9ACTN|nr:winged helix-turn-helix domain-containing protein [Streptomyces kaniharaensis]MQS15771.1 helix-turn-helix transcriptional regulator [Streptomyces kaniharaensis]